MRRLAHRLLFLVAAVACAGIWAPVAQAQLRGGGRGPAVTQYTAPGASVPRSISSKLADVLSVRDYGAVGDGSTDDTSAVQAALVAAGGKTLLFPPGTYKITGTLAISVPGSRVVGQSATVFMAFTSSAPVGGVLFSVTAGNVEFDGLIIDSTGSTNVPVATINHYAIRMNGSSGTHLSNLSVRNCAFTNLPWNDTLGAVVATHAVYIQWADNVTVENNQFESPAGAAVFFSGVTNAKILNNNINNTGWYSIQFNDLVSNSRISGNSITGTTLGSRVWGGSINLMSNDSTGTACGTPGCARVRNIEIDHNYIAGNHSYTGAVHIESCSHIRFHHNTLENITLTLAADMLARYGQHTGSGTTPFYPDASAAVYIRPYVRPTNVPATGNEGPNDHIEISDNDLIAGSVSAIGIYFDAQDNSSPPGTGSATPLAYSDTIVIKGNRLQSLDSTHYFGKAIIGHGQQGGWRHVSILENEVSGFPDTASPVSGLIGVVANSTAPTIDVQIVGNSVVLAGGTVSSSLQLGVSIDAWTQLVQVSRNAISGFWNGFRTFANASQIYVGAGNAFSGNTNGDVVYGAGAFPGVQVGGTTSSIVSPVVTAPRGSDLAATTIVSLADFGEYRVCASARTTATGTGTTATLNIIWTDEGGVKTHAVGTFSLNSVAAGGQINACDYVHAAAGSNIQVSVSGGTYGTSQYTLTATAEKLR